MRKKENKKTNNKLVVKIILIIILVIITLAVIILCRNIKKTGIFYTEKRTTIEYNSYIDVTYSKNAILKSLGGEALIYEKGYLYTINSKSNTTCKYEVIKLNQPEIMVSGRNFILVDKSNGMYYLFRNKKLVCEGKLGLEIKEVAINNKGYFAIGLSDKGYKNVINLYDNTGENIKKYYLMSDLITNLKLTNKSLIYTEFLVNANNINTKLNEIVIGESEFNVKNIINLENKTIYNYDLLNSYAIINTNNNIYKYDFKSRVSTLLEEDLQENILFAENDNSHIITVKSIQSNAPGKRVVLESKNYLLNYSNSVSLNNEPEMLNAKDGIIVLVTDKKIDVYNYLGQKLKAFESNSIISQIEIINNGNSIVLVTANKVYILNL